MSITNATELKTALSNWTHRTDTAFTARCDEFIALLEARLNRSLRVKGMEATMASTALSSGAASLPTAFLAFKELRYDGSPSYTLKPRPLEWIRSQADQASAPGYFAVTDTQVVCWPQTGNIKGTYYRSLPSLTSNSSNWLLTAHPDVYLFGCLEEAALWLQDEQRGQLWAARAKQLMDQIQSADIANQINGGPLTIRAR